MALPYIKGFDINKSESFVLFGVYLVSFIYLQVRPITLDLMY